MWKFEDKIWLSIKQMKSVTKHTKFSLSSFAMHFAFFVVKSRFRFQSYIVN